MAKATRPSGKPALRRVPARHDPTILDRLRQICMGLPEAHEKLSHGEPTWFARSGTGD